MIVLKQGVKIKQDGAYFDLFVISNANTNLFPAGYNKWRKKFEIKVCSQAKNNKANQEVLNTIATFFKKSIKDVYIVSGKNSKLKTVLVKGISLNSAVKQLQESLNEL